LSSVNQILLAFYGDDFTGSTDALEFMSRAGAKAVLFIEPPTKEQLARYPDLDAFGVAGMTRSMKPADMEKELLPAFQQLKQSGARHIHYKICSTFDSSPAIGSIGKAIDTGADVFSNVFVPLLVAAPLLGRYSVFGNHFARMGTAGSGTIYRLDRHPSMSKHPVTPSDESDLRVHLSKQTNKKIGLVDIVSVSISVNAINESIDQQIKEGAEIILFDAIYQEQLDLIGECIDQRAKQATLFSAGSSGIEMALGQYWNRNGRLQPVTEWKPVGKASPMLVIAGSCSPVTAAQIEQAKRKGFEEVIVELSKTGIPADQIIGAVSEYIKKGKSVVVHTNGMAKGETMVAPQIAGAILGTIAGKVALAVPYKRLVIAGGDTSSYAARALGIESVEMIAALVPGAPLCKANAPGSPVDGIEVNFKGGQVGDENYFEILLNGTSPSSIDN
jgi:3-oxoisoapionate kinase